MALLKLELNGGKARIKQLGFRFMELTKVNRNLEFVKLGIKERRVTENESVSEMGYKVAVSAISNANINKEDIDMIIVD
jgi:3-oxoacyl-[acyl-carrier-protein] synthase-3